MYCKSQKIKNSIDLNISILKLLYIRVSSTDKSQFSIWVFDSCHGKQCIASWKLNILPLKRQCKFSSNIRFQIILYCSNPVETVCAKACAPRSINKDLSSTLALSHTLQKYLGLFSHIALNAHTKCNLFRNFLNYFRIKN